MIKKIAILAALIVSFTATKGQLVRMYPNSAYMLEFEKEKVNRTVVVKIRWSKSDPSTMNNIDYVEYPDGYFKLLTYPKYKDKTDEGKPIYECVVKDEGDREKTCYIMKNNNKTLTFALQYDDVIIGFSVNLLEFLDAK